ncbi:MAG: primosomal protein N' [Alphaproteobacteria bacterium]|jgi:primosomal protein N' (replication factor Y)|nr:primosomal protein N' [Alphaproteobacteria bacterium]
MTKPPANPALTSPDHTVRVMTDLPVGHGYDYLVPNDLSIENGNWVSIPLGRTEAVGAVWGDGTGEVTSNKLKAINSVLDLPPLPDVTRHFVDWVADYTLSAPGLILKMVMGGRLRPLKPKDRLDFPLPNPDHKHLSLTEEQAIAAAQMVADVKKGRFSVTLLDGVTGSGKTEVYAEAIAQCLRNGQQALVLLPEIAMTAALFYRLKERFGCEPTLWHSGLSEKQRRLNWHAITQGKARFVLGARSALFLPFPDLGLIVVDEEHEGAYKQEEGVIYHGRDMAVVRAHLGAIPIILATATPSLETLHNVQQGKYKHLVLHSRFGLAQMPEIIPVDLRHEKLASQEFISEPLLAALKETVEAGQQAMLFLNRRGYAPLTLCRACGARLQCPSCTSWLIEHKRTGRLHCHQCGYSLKRPDVCPTCEAEGKLAACGPGIERIAEEVQARLPNIRTAIMASDTLDGPAAAEALIRQVEDHSIDLLIGTQIMAKGYHFPRLTLVGVIDADLGLAGGDPRAAERTFQLLQQVAGRSGRAEDKGRVFLQTVNPDHPVIEALITGARDSFMAAELQERQNYHLPPFGRMASLTIAGADQKQVIEVSRKIAAAAPQAKGLRILGPAPAPFALLRGKTRYRLMIQTERPTIALSKVIRDWLAPLKLPRNIRLHIDIDPYSFL